MNRLQSHYFVESKIVFMDNNRNTRLQKLSDSDFEISDGQSDIRGWDVKDSGGKRLGEVEELIFDYESRKVRYIVVDTENNEYNLEDREVLVPIGIAELHESDDDVVLPGITADQLLALPEYNEDRFSTEDETNTRNVFGGLGAGGLTAAGTEDFYTTPHFNEENLYRNRRKGKAGDDNTASGSDGLFPGKASVDTGAPDSSIPTQQQALQGVSYNDESQNIQSAEDETDSEDRGSAGTSPDKNSRNSRLDDGNAFIARSSEI